MNKLIVAITILFVFPLTSCAQKMTYELFLEKHIEARGGKRH